MEEGEIQESVPQTGHQRRSLSQNFTAPRFAALAAQQEQGEIVGPSGRPQLAPNFMFGARRRPSSAMPMGPPISEEDVGFQFPQQQTQPSYSLDTGLDANRRKPDNTTEISGIMAEQVSRLRIIVPGVLFVNIIPDRTTEPDRSPPTATAGTIQAAACFQSGPIIPDAGPCSGKRYDSSARSEHHTYGCGHQCFRRTADCHGSIWKYR